MKTVKLLACVATLGLAACGTSHKDDPDSEVGANPSAGR